MEGPEGSIVQHAPACVAQRHDVLSRQQKKCARIDRWYRGCPRCCRASRLICQTRHSHGTLRGRNGAGKILSRPSAPGAAPEKDTWSGFACRPQKQRHLETSSPWSGKTTLMANLEAQLRVCKTHVSPEAATTPVERATIVSRGAVPPFRKSEDSP